MDTIWDRMMEAGEEVKGFKVPPEGKATSLRDEEAHGLDSIGRVEYLLALEEAFHIELPNEEIDNLETLGDVEILIAQRMQAPVE